MRESQTGEFVICSNAASRNYNDEIQKARG